MARSADLPGLRLPVVVSARRAQAPKSVAMVRSSGPESDSSRRWRKRISSRMLRLSLDARLSVPRQTIGAPFQHRAIGMRGMAEPGMGPRAEGDGHAVAAGRGLGTELPEVVRLEVSAVGDQPVGVAQLAATDVVGRPRADRLPFVVPGTDLFEETPHRAVAVLQQPQFLGHLGQVG